jgi:hypothetical protein
MPRLWTHGQLQKINLLVRGHLTGLAPQRQVGFLRNWLRHNAGTSALPLFPTATDAELRTLISDLGEHLGLYTTHPAFRSALAAVSRGGGIQYAAIVGRFGSLSAELVETICTQYRMMRPVLVTACSTMAAAQGQNGVKVIVHSTYTAELKLMPMGGERVYSTSTRAPYDFTRIAKHL